MMRSRLLLLGVSFGVGVSLSLALGRELKSALLAGAIAVPATFSGVLAMNLARQQQLREFEQYWRDLQASLTAMTVERHKETVMLNSLRVELGQLQIQIGNQWQRKDRLQQELATLTSQQAQLEPAKVSALPAASHWREVPHALSHQRQALEEQWQPILPAMSKQAGRDRIAPTLAVDPPIASSAHHQRFKEQWQQEVASLEQQQEQLQASNQQLHDEVTELEQQRDGLKQSLSLLETENHSLEAALSPLRAEYQQLQQQLASLRQTLEKTRRETSAAKEAQARQAAAQAAATSPKASQSKPQPPQPPQKPKPTRKSKPSATSQAVPCEVVAEKPKRGKESRDRSPATIDIAAQAVTESPQLPSKQPVAQPTKPTAPEPDLLIAVEPTPTDSAEDWGNFVARLTEPEFQVLKAIAEQDDPNPAIKQIAEAQVTMPELLVDAINERALDHIGDIIVEPGSGYVPPAIVSEYLKQVNQLLDA